MPSYNSRNTIYQSIAGKILRETDKALLLSYADAELNKNVSIWIPISQCAHIVRAKEGDSESNCILMVAEWVLTKAGADYKSLTPEEQGRLNAHKVQSEGAYDSRNTKSGSMKSNVNVDPDSDIPF